MPSVTFISQDCLLNKHPCKDSLKQKDSGYLAHKTWKIQANPWRTVSDNMKFIFNFFIPIQGKLIPFDRI